MLRVGVTCVNRQTIPTFQRQICGIVYLGDRYHKLKVVAEMWFRMSWRR